MQPRRTPRCDSTFLQLFWWEFQHPEHLLLGLCGAVLTTSLWALTLVPENVLAFHSVFSYFSIGVIPSKGIPTKFYLMGKRNVYHRQNSWPNAGGVTLLRFIRFDEIEHYNQSKNSYFMAHVQEMAVMKSLLYVKHNGQQDTFKVQNVYLWDICQHQCHQTAHVMCSQYTSFVAKRPYEA